MRLDRGGVERLPGESLPVSVYAGIDPVSKKRHYLDETVSAGPSAARDAERVRTRLLNQVDERRNPRTKATVNQLLDRWLEVVELETTTRNGVVGRLEPACAAPPRSSGCSASPPGSPGTELSPTSRSKRARPYGYLINHRLLGIAHHVMEHAVPPAAWDEIRDGI